MTRKRPATRASERALTPDSHITINVTQLIALIVGVVTLAGGYWYLISTQAKQTSDIARVQTTIEAVTHDTTAQVKDQNDKRETLAKDFLASNQKIADRVSDLNTQMVLTQQAAKVTNDTLSQIRDQLAASPWVSTGRGKK